MGKVRVFIFYILDILKKYLFIAFNFLLLVVDVSKMFLVRLFL